MGNTPDTPADPLPPAAHTPDTVDLPALSGPDATLPTMPTALTAIHTGALADYELLGEIERGGMGIVYRARERHSGRLVALKMMLPDSASASSDRRRFLLEAHATGELHHPGIVAIHAWGEHNGVPFYTMDFVPGVPLSRLLQSGPIPCDRAVPYLRAIARAVGAAHALGIVHRDLKPANVIIDLSDQPRVLDFGLAKRLRTHATDALDTIPEALPVSAPLPIHSTSSQRTEKGAILGTPSYMAPEQVRAEHEQVGPPADVHALGAIFYEMLAGRPPFQGASSYETMLQVLQQPPAPLRSLAPHVPAALEDFCRRCLEKDAHARYPNANVLADDLERRWNRAVRVARFARLTAAAVVVLLLLAALRFFFHHSPLALNLERLVQRASELTQVGEPLRRAAPRRWSPICSNCLLPCWRLTSPRWACSSGWAPGYGTPSGPGAWSESVPRWPHWS